MPDYFDGSCGNTSPDVRAIFSLSLEPHRKFKLARFYLAAAQRHGYNKPVARSAEICTDNY